MKDEYQKQFQMEYMDLSKYLQKKYGKPTSPYFLAENCKTQNKKITRVNEGLFIHHIAEYHKEYPAINNLSSTNEAIKFPYEFQTPNWLCYCDYIEHVILHYKIHKLRIGKSANIPLDDGIVHYMLPELKYWYQTNGKDISVEWKKKVWNVIKEEKQTFIEIYNMFYKEFPNEAKYSYSEFISAEKHNKLKRKNR